MTIDTEVKEYVDQEMNRVYEKLDVIEKVLVGRMDSLEKGLNYRIGGLESRIDGLRSEFGGVRDMVSTLFHLYQPLLEKFDKIIDRFNSLEKYVKKKLEEPKTGFPGKSEPS